MANTPVEAFDSGSNYNFGSKMEQASFPSSVFDLSHLVATTIENCGNVQVIDSFPTLPSDTHEITVRSLLRALPQVVPLYSRQRVYIYAFYSRCSDLWANWNTFMTKGYTGDEILTIPVFNDNNLKQELGDKVLPGSLADNLGLPQGLSVDKLKGLNALQAMMLLRIYRDYFMNKNHFINDRVLLPHNDNRFMLNDDGQLLSALDEGVDFKFDLTSDDYKGYQVDLETGARTFSQFCHDWPEDYFTSALPWPQRGTAATLEGQLDIVNKPITTSSGEQLNLVSTYENFLGPSVLAVKKTVEDVDRLYPIMGSGSFSIEPQSGLYWLDRPATPETAILSEPTRTSPSTQTIISNKTFKTDISGTANFNLVLNDLRQLAVDQTELEKMARTDGSYLQFGLTFYGEKAKNSTNYKPLLIGATYDSISYTEVLQTSQQYTVNEGSVEPVGSPLGTYGGHGIAGSKDYIGKVHCDDYGYIMILACVMPDVYYSQGLKREWFSLYQADQFLPERAKLGLRPILKKELVFTGDSTIDDDLWAHQNPFDEYRYLPNLIKGKIADSSSESFWPYTQSRKFENVPEYGHVFAEASDVRKDYLASYEEVAFTAQFAIDIRSVRPLPYKPVPADILN